MRPGSIVFFNLSHRRFVLNVSAKCCCNNKLSVHVMLLISFWADALKLQPFCKNV